MAKIKPEEHLTIFEKYTSHGVSVKDLAEQYRCSGANIYTIINKLKRRNGSPRAQDCENSAEAAGGTEPTEATGKSQVEPDPASNGTVHGQAEVPAASALELIQHGIAAASEPPAIARAGRPARTAGISGPGTLPLELPLPEPKAGAESTPAGASSQSPSAAPMASRLAAQPRFKDALGGSQKRGSAKKGVGVLIRSDDGEETIPCPNIETAMQNARAILRQTVRSPGMWIRLEEIDLSEFRDDADAAA